WFRRHIVIDSTLHHQPLALHIVQSGASEIYLNGELLYRIGKVGNSIEEEKARWDQYFPKAISFDDRPEHVIAVRYSNVTTEEAEQ
ncbi:MAG: hypothetical protein GWN61_22025, partial [candidate division Zixibacteria bacterium]|nr:hypothetical protein [candidate division Zixibacteria bacterium]NIT74400.1 hypothetical protein [candidate division KSB1 bacterium]NIW49233.1 hypothetical protein [Gammaproteobacteria bacterium]NIS48542.1 hypothetical protein [candidate division Zixibacteria bacterium]NIU16630.1 hypothetical protein [candidate division Zixibacteria bacterium]